MYFGIAIIFLGILCSILTLVLLRFFRRNNIVNVHLITAFIIADLYFILHGIYHIVSIDFPISFLNFIYFVLFWFFNPVIYLYFKNLEINSKFINFKDLIHFVIPVLSLILVIYYQYKLTIFLRVLSLGALLVQSSVYSYKSYWILKRSFWKTFKNKEKNTLEKVIITNWITFVFYAVVILQLHLIISSFISVFDNITPIGCNIYIENIITIVGLFIIIKLLFSPNLLYGLRTNSKPVKSLSSNFIIKPIWNLEANRTIKSKDKALNSKIRTYIPTYISQIEELSLEELVFRQSNYGLNDLATDLGLPKYYLEYLFKYHCSLTFIDYKKLIKVYDSVQLIDDDFLNKGTLEALRIKVGYASYNPFLINFKYITGVSPVDFSKNRKIKNHTFITSTTNK